MTKKLNTEKDAAPLYIQIKNDLKNKIESGHWKIGDKITSELELCDHYNVSRITVREAINELVWERYLERKRAKGTFVLDYKRGSTKDYFTHVKSLAYEVNESGKDTKTFDAEIKKIKANDLIARQLDVPLNSEVIQLNRLRGVGNKYPIFFKSYWKYTPVYSLDSNDYYGSFYEVLEKHGIEVVRIKEYLEAIIPNKEIQKQLNVSNDVPILKRVRNATNAEDSFIEYTECYYVGENYRYYINIDFN